MESVFSSWKKNGMDQCQQAFLCGHKKILWDYGAQLSKTNINRHPYTQAGMIQN